jgi:hypothetical protein
LEDDFSLTTLCEIELRPADGDKREISDLVVEDGLLYAYDRRVGIIMIDIEDPSELKIVSRCDSIRPVRIDVVDGLVYAACAHGSAGIIGGCVAIVDMLREGNDKVVAARGLKSACSIAVHGNYVFAGQQEDGVTVFVSNRSSLAASSVSPR